MRKIPGLKAEIFDFQIKSDPITNPGEIVILLCDLPDQITISDDNNPGEVLHLPVPANVPLLINGTTELKELILGSELTEGLGNLIGNDRHLDIVNVLPMLSSTLPLAVCKIVRRNGERPDTSNTKELYEALEVAYESLENYPAGFIVPLGVSIEDVVVSNSNNVTVEKYIGNEVVATGQSVFRDVKASLFFEPGKSEFYDKIKVELDAVVDTDAKTLKAKISAFNGSTNILQETDTTTYTLIPSEVNSVSEKYAKLEKLVAASGDVPFNIPTADYLPLVQEDTIEAQITLAKNEKGILIIDPALTKDRDLTKVITKDLIIDSVKVATLTLEYKIKKLEAVTYETSGYTVDWNNIGPGEMAYKLIQKDIEPYKWYVSGSTFLLKTEVGAEINTPVVFSAVEVPARKISGYALNQLTEFRSKKGNVSLNRSAFTVEKYIKATETRSNETVLIDFVDNFNSYSVSSLIEIESVYKKENVWHALINEEEIALPDLKILTSFSKLFVLENYTLNYKDALKIELLAGLELPAKNATFNLEITVVPAGADFSKRAVDFCDYLTKQMNDCRVVMGVKPPKTTSAEDIKDQVARVTKFIANKSYLKGKLDAGAYLVVVTGAQKVNNYGGITNFSETKILSFEAQDKKIVVDSSLSFVVGDKIDLIYTRKGKTMIDENIVEDVVSTPDGYEIILKNALTSAFVNTSILTTRKIQITNAKDRKGSFLAALYATTANNFGVDKAPFNATLSGSSEVFYSANQLKQLAEARLTPITRNVYDTNGYVFDTPTLAGSASDFQDQETIGLVLYFIRVLRNISASRKGQRFGSADKQLIFNTELEAPFKDQIGKTIVSYRLNVDYSTLNKDNQLNISFEIKDAKKLKSVKITARLY